MIGYLRSHEIDAVLLDGAMSSMLPLTISVRIAVPDDQEDLALTLLARAEAGDTLPEVNDEP